MREQQHILIYRVGQLGDALVAMPAIQAIASKHKRARLVLLTDRHQASSGYVSSWDVIRPSNLIDEAIFYEPRNRTRLSRVKDLMSLIHRLRSFGFDEVYNLVMRTSERQVKRDHFFFRVVVGAPIYHSMPPVFYPPNRNTTGELQQLMPEWRRLLSMVKNEGDYSQFRLPIGSDAIVESVAVWPVCGDQRKDLVIAIAPGSKMSAKRWPETRFADLGRRLLSIIPNLHLVVIGGKEDVELGDQLCATWGTSASNLAGKVSIYGSAAILQRCSLYVGNDTGAMHLAAMVGVPCVAIFSARDYPGLWEPYGSTNTVIRKELDCSGCMLEVCQERRSACLREISVEDVEQAIFAHIHSQNRLA